MKKEIPSIDSVSALIARQKECEPPAWLEDRIMEQVQAKRPSLLGKLRAIMTLWVNQPGPASLPLYGAVAVVVLLCGIWLGKIGSSTSRSAIVETTNGIAYYHLGRGFLEAGNPKEALYYFNRASELDSGVAEFVHWKGVAYWSLGDKERERESYFQSLEKQPGYLPSLVHLGHNYLEQGKYEQAISYYEKSLEKESALPVALYNRALALVQLGEPEKALEAFTDYLSYYRQGEWAQRAVIHQQRLGGYDYRFFNIDGERLIVNSDILLRGDETEVSLELEMLASTLSDASFLELHFVVFMKENGAEAKSRAKFLKKQFEKIYGDELPIRLSWFDIAERVQLENGRILPLSNGLLVFTREIETKRTGSST